MTATARAIIFGAIGSLFLAGLPLIAAVGPAGGSQQGPQVINGSNAAAGAWPAMAAIGYRGESAKRGTFCGGTLVAEGWVLTAAHCLSGLKAKGVVVRVGITSLKNASDTEIRVAKIYTKKYKPRKDINDIALLKLKQVSDKTPMGLATAAMYVANAPATVIGWGATKPNGRKYPSKLQQGTVEITPDARCEKMWREANTKKQVCAGIGGANSVDTCAGDSGGPLILADAAGVPQVAGIVSYGPQPCANPRRRAVYTKTSHYAGWIESTIGGPPGPAPTPTPTPTPTDSGATTPSPVTSAPAPAG